MGTYIIKTPDIGEGIAEVELVAWHVKPGDKVVMDQVLADVMTDKATVEVPSPVAGEVVALGGTPGQTVAVGSELVRLEVQGAGNLKAGQELASAASVASPAAVVPPAVPADRPAAAPIAPASAANERPIAAPAVRRRAWELGIELDQVRASGTAGRITHADLDAYAASHPAAVAAPQRAPAAAAPAPVYIRTADGAATRADERIPVIGLRRKIALKMQDAKRRIAHFTYVEEVDVTEVEALRERLNAQWGETRGRLTMLPLLARAMALAVDQYPQMNARFDDEAGVITRHGAVHLGIATQTDNGLMVPVVRDAQAYDLWANAAEIARVAQRARTGQATREELGGSTITITSLGALGGIVSTPVINHPEVAIVGVNRMVERPVVLRGAVVIRKMMNLSASFDHRVIDGMDAALFVQAIRGYLEAPATMFV
ncbi:MAG: dihydrolipoamide acetyltransferase family protein [Burkholderiales bacterium]|nr:dihydrolipoamide acetyltransferase family protein [Burkholderiales bacterium]